MTNVSQARIFACARLAYREGDLQWAPNSSAPIAMCGARRPGGFKALLNSFGQIEFHSPAEGCGRIFAFISYGARHGEPEVADRTHFTEVVLYPLTVTFGSNCRVSNGIVTFLRDTGR